MTYVVDAAGGGGGGGGRQRKRDGNGSGTGTGGTGTDSSSGAGAGGGPLARFSLGPLPASFTPSAAGAIRLLAALHRRPRPVAERRRSPCRGRPPPVRSAATTTTVIASARYAVASNKSARIVIKLNPIGRKRLRLSRTALPARP